VSRFCIYCGSNEKLTLDHVPPKLLLVKPYPKNLITVPACFRCNQSFQKDDEYVRTIAGLDIRASQNRVARLKLGPVERSLRRPDATSFAEYLKRQSTKSVVLNRNGAPMSEVIDADRKRVDAVGRRLVRGLYYFETGHPLPQDAVITIGAKTGIHPLDEGATVFASVYSRCPEHRNREIGDAFSYIVGISPIATVWLLLLYEYFVWMATVQTGDQRATAQG
jgi:hypothetical protein